jgi:hypothetical protein
MGRSDISRAQQTVRHVRFFGESPSRRATSIWIKSTHVNQDLLIRSDSDRFFAPPYVGPSGWIGMYLDKKPDWKILESIVRDAYCLTAPRKLSAALER